MLILNSKIITWQKPNQILEGYALLIQNDRIVEIAKQAQLLINHPDEEQLDARGQYLMPGNICGHTHFYGAFARGMAIPGSAPRDFPEILQKLWWPLDKSLTKEAVRLSALVCLIDAARYGTTTLLDHHASPNAIHGSLDEIASAARMSGLRIACCYEVTDRDGEEKAQAGIQENLRFIDEIRRLHDNHLLAALFGLHASLTLSEKTLETCRQMVPEGVGFHIHVAEHQADQFDSIEKSGTRVVDRLYKHGILGEKTIVAHAVHVDAREVETLAATRTWVMHQPRSNMNNAVGMAEVESMLRAGVNLAMGNDGFSNAMWEEWKTAYLVHKLWHRDPRRVTGYDVIDMAVYNNARMASCIFGEQIGVIQPDAQADLILVDYHPFTPLNEDNLPWHILFGFHDSMVTTMLVAGKVIMRDRVLQTLDEEKITYEALKLSPQVWDRYHSSFSKA